MENGYGRKRQKELTQPQGTRTIQPDRANLWRGYSGQRQRRDKCPGHWQLVGETIYE